MTFPPPHHPPRGRPAFARSDRRILPDWHGFAGKRTWAGVGAIVASGDGRNQVFCLTHEGYQAADVLRGRK